MDQQEQEVVVSYQGGTFIVAFKTRRRRFVPLSIMNHRTGQMLREDDSRYGPVVEDAYRRVKVMPEHRHQLDGVAEEG